METLCGGGEGDGGGGEGGGGEGGGDWHVENGQIR